MEKRIIILFMVWITLISTMIPSWAQESSLREEPANVTKIVPDLIFVRPAGLVWASFTTSAFLISLPVVYPLDRGYRLLSRLVEQPWNYVSDRPLGVFHPETDITQVIDLSIKEQYGDILELTGANQDPLTMD